MQQSEPTDAELAALRKFAPYCNREGQCPYCRAFLNGYRGVERPASTALLQCAAWRRGRSAGPSLKKQEREP